jgi:hypothetical protein
LSPLGELVGRLSDQLLESGCLTNVPSELFGPPRQIPTASRERIENALLTALGTEPTIPPGKPIEVDAAERLERLIQLLRTHTKTLKRDDVADFKHRYTPPLGKLSPESFEQIFAQMQVAVLQTGELDQQGATVHKGNKFNEFREVLDELLRKHGVARFLA